MLDTAGSPERGRWLHLARSGSQSHCAIWLILPARGASHITNWLISLKLEQLTMKILIGSGLNLLYLQSHSKPECRWTWPEVNRGQTQELAQCTHTRWPAAKISPCQNSIDTVIETIAEPVFIREKK